MLVLFQNVPAPYVFAYPVSTRNNTQFGLRFPEVRIRRNSVILAPNKLDTHVTPE